MSDLAPSPEVGKSSVDRMAFFSDAVVAIAMTLLAIDLPVPNSDSAHGLSEFVGDHINEYVAFLISFFVIGLYWRGHHRAYRYVTDAPSSLIRWNTLWLLTVVLTPYATRTLYGGPDVRHTDFPWRFAFYAVIQALAAFFISVSEREVLRLGLFSPETPPELITRGRIRNFVLLVVFALSIPLAFLIGPWAFVLWFLIPVGMRVGIRLADRRRAEAASG